MHMADALVSPWVGGAFWVISGALIGHSAKKIAAEKDYSKTPLMGILGAFVFAAQMINFTIPGTGSSGHLGGGLLLTALLGPYRAFITIASVLTIQCFLFADGGILALGCNIFNLGFFPAFIAFPFIYRLTPGNRKSPVTIGFASITAATAGLLMGALSVIFQTLLSGISELPFTTFSLFMLPIHLVIGIIEGLVVWMVLIFVSKAEPSLLIPANTIKPSRRILITLAVTALLIGGVVSWFASSNPDGLEWSISKVTGQEELIHSGNAIHSILDDLQKKFAFLPDYSFKATESLHSGESHTPPESVSSVRTGTSFSGVAGSLLVLLLVGITGYFLRSVSKKSRADT